jgi:hypothetical protein
MISKDQRHQAMTIRNKLSNAMTYFVEYQGTDSKLSKKALTLWESVFRVVVLGGKYENPHKDTK